jgi:hypothetical protein
VQTIPPDLSVVTVAQWFRNSTVRLLHATNCNNTTYADNLRILLRYCHCWCYVRCISKMTAEQVDQHCSRAIVQAVDHRLLSNIVIDGRDTPQTLHRTAHHNPALYEHWCVGTVTQDGRRPAALGGCSLGDNVTLLVTNKPQYATSVPVAATVNWYVGETQCCSLRVPTLASPSSCKEKRLRHCDCLYPLRHERHNGHSVCYITFCVCYTRHISYPLRLIEGSAVHLRSQP